MDKFIKLLLALGTVVTAAGTLLREYNESPLARRQRPQRRNRRRK